MTSHTLIFTRREKDKVGSLALLTIDVLDGKNDVSLEDRLSRAVTDWMRETSDGRSAWKRSVEDFNIGDLASESLADIQPFCHRHGFMIESLATPMFDDAMDWDWIIPDPSGLEETTP